MLYMVIERFKDAPAIYRRLREKGRMMPEGLEYVSSWVAADLKICWQLMRAEDESLFHTWINNWKDLADFEVVPVCTSAEVREMMEATTVGKPLATGRIASIGRARHSRARRGS